MKELQDRFIGKGEVKGFEFTQLKKNQYAYIYSVINFYGSSISKRYEVFERKENQRYNCISYPKSKSFGKWAWSVMSLDRAIDIFNEITLRKSIAEAKEASNGRG